MTTLILPQVLPSYKDIINAPEGEWRQLVELVDGDMDYYARCRANASKPKTKRRSRRARRASRSTRNFSTASVLSRIAPAMSEALDRVNSDSILINRADGFVEVIHA